MAAGKGLLDGTHLRCYPSYASGAGTSRSRATGGYAVRSLFPVRLHSLVYYKVRKNPKSPNRYHSGLGTRIILASTKSKCQRQEDMKNIPRKALRDFRDGQGDPVGQRWR